MSSEFELDRVLFRRHVGEAIALLDSKDWPERKDLWGIVRFLSGQMNREAALWLIALGFIWLQRKHYDDQGTVDGGSSTPELTNPK
jgi:hypothetical protein